MIYVSESVWAATTTGGCQRVVGGEGGRLQLISTLAEHNGFKSFQFFFFWPDSQSEHREHRGKHDDDDRWKSGSSSGLIYCGSGSEGVPVVVVVCLDVDVSLGLVISTFWLHLQLIDWWMLRFGSNKVQIKSKWSVGSFNNFSLCGVPAVIFRWDRGPVAAAAKSQTTSSHSITGLMSL